MKEPPAKKWDVFPRIPEEIDSQLSDFPFIFRQVLYNRGIENIHEAERFLGASGDLHNPFLMKDMSIAVDRIRQAIHDGKTIMVFGDYDADGVTATALLVQALKSLGARVSKYIPNRFNEGYGFSMNALERVLIEKPDMLITVDCGVRSVEEVALVKQNGIEVIITDHHQPFENILPEAAAVICPKQRGDEYPYPDLAGVGIAYKLAQALQISQPESRMNVDQWVDLVAIGTVADLAPLTDENRVLTRRGIERIRRGEHVGIAALATVSSNNNLLSINSGHIGFIIAPRLNAAGRLSTAEKAYQLLMTQNKEEALQLAYSLNIENQARQKETMVTFQKVEKYFLDRDEDWLMFYVDEENNEGIVGLAASKLTERFYRPAIIGAISGDIIHASCRSIDELNITRALDQCADLLERHGGHAMAAGLTLKKVNAGVFAERLSSIIQNELAGVELTPTVKAEMEVGLSCLKPTIIPLLEFLDPCGVGNPTPLFISRNVEIKNIKTMGNDKAHLRLDVCSRIDSNNRSRITYTGVGFNLGWKAESLCKGRQIDILYSFGNNEFNDRINPQLYLRDIKISEDINMGHL